MYSLCSESAVTDAASNKISAFNIIDQLTLAQFPALIPRITLIFGLEREGGDPEQFDGILTFSHNTTEVARWPISINFGEHPRARLLTIINGLVIPTPGEFRFVLNSADVEVGHWELPVTQPEPPSPQITAQPQG